MKINGIQSITPITKKKKQKLSSPKYKQKNIGVGQNNGDTLLPLFHLIPVNR